MSTTAIAQDHSQKLLFLSSHQKRKRNLQIKIIRAKKWSHANPRKSLCPSPRTDISQIKERRRFQSARPKWRASRISPCRSKSTLVHRKKRQLTQREDPPRREWYMNTAYSLMGHQFFRKPSTGKRESAISHCCVRLWVCVCGLEGKQKGKKAKGAPTSRRLRNKHSTFRVSFLLGRAQ
jgi:hypothetical protein